MTPNGETDKQRAAFLRVVDRYQVAGFTPVQIATLTKRRSDTIALAIKQIERGHHATNEQ